MAKSRAGDRRRKLRDECFGADSWERVWKSADEKKGYACVPRILPILMQLAHDKKITGNQDCRSTLLELYCANWGEAIVEIQDESGHGLRAGFGTDRAARSWRERIYLLAEAGFIEVREKSSRPIGYVMLRHPMSVLSELRAQRKMDQNLWLAYAEVCREFGLPAPEDPLALGPRGIVRDEEVVQAAAVGDDDIPF